MNVIGIGPELTPLNTYAKVAVPLTLATIWVLVAYELQSMWWPYNLFCAIMQTLLRKFQSRRGKDGGCRFDEEKQ